jgi:hypothetical protein
LSKNLITHLSESKNSSVSQTLSPLSEKDKDKHLDDMDQKYSNGEISREQYTRALGFKYQERTKL